MLEFPLSPSPSSLQQNPELFGILVLAYPGHSGVLAIKTNIMPRTWWTVFVQMWKCWHQFLHVFSYFNFGANVFSCCHYCSHFCVCVLCYYGVCVCVCVCDYCSETICEERNPYRASINGLFIFCYKFLLFFNWQQFTACNLCQYSLLHIALYCACTRCYIEIFSLTFWCFDTVSRLVKNLINTLFFGLPMWYLEWLQKIAQLNKKDKSSVYTVGPKDCILFIFSITL